MQCNGPSTQGAQDVIDLAGRAGGAFPATRALGSLVLGRGRPIAEAAASARCFAPLPVAATNEPARPRRICIVSSDLVGPVRNGGVGTAYSALAQALAGAGHEVTLLYVLGKQTDGDPIDKWIAHYRAQGIAFEPLPERPGLEAGWHTIKSYETYLWLRKRAFDVIHFPEWRGHGYFSLVAKHQGLAFAATTLCVGVHGPTLWHKAGNFEYLDRIDDLELDFMERQCVALADVVVSPSQYLLQWMLEQGWTLPARCHVQQNILPQSIMPRDGCDARGAQPRTIRELVFFGRLEGRKGLVLFCDAIDRLARRGQPPVQITFLGKAGAVLGRAGDDYIADRAHDWPFAWQILADRDAAGARDYLLGDGRLAIIPSLVENSPYTVLECLGAGLPFLAGRVGGIPELIAPGDREEVLFLPRADALAQRLAQCLQEGVRPARLAMDPAASCRAWLAWHAGLQAENPEPSLPEACTSSPPLVSVCLTHFDRPAYLRQALESLAHQDYSPFEVVLVDDGSTQPEALALLEELKGTFTSRGWQLIRQDNRFPGAARNTAARHARGDLLLFMDDDNYALPHEISTYVRVVQRTGADILTSVINAFEGAAPPQIQEAPLKCSLPLGGAVAVGALNNCFGDMNALVRKECFLAVGGFTEDYGLGHEDWEFFARAVLLGYQFEVIPEPLFWYRLSASSVTRSTPHAANDLRHLRPYLNAVPRALRDLIAFCQGARIRNDAMAAEHGSMYRYALNLQQHSQELKAWSDEVTQKHQNLQRWYEALEQQHLELRGGYDRLHGHYQDLRRWSEEMEQRAAQLAQAKVELTLQVAELHARLAQFHHRLADRLVTLFKKIPLAHSLTRTVLRLTSSARG